MVAVGLRPTTRQAYSSQGFGLVVGQDPPAGTELAPGTSITLTVSIGPPPVQADDNHRRDRGPGKKRSRDNRCLGFGQGFGQKLGDVQYPPGNSRCHHPTPNLENAAWVVGYDGVGSGGGDLV